MWAGCSTSFFAYCMRESVCLQVCKCTRQCLFALPVDGEPVIFFSWLDTHLNKSTHQEMYSKKKKKRSKQSQNSVILNPISTQASNFSSQTHNGALTREREE